LQNGSGFQIAFVSFQSVGSPVWVSSRSFHAPNCRSFIIENLHTDYLTGHHLVCRFQYHPKMELHFV
jgi:hypothetical protein